MNKFERLLDILRHVPDLQVGQPELSDERVHVSAKVSIASRTVSEQLPQPPETGSGYAIFKPRALKKALRAQRAQPPLEILKQMAPEWLDGGALKASKTRRSEVIAYRRITRKVVDRVDTASCVKCNGKGAVTVSRTEATSLTCAYCGGVGTTQVTTYINAPGSTAHGMPRSEARVCMHCAGRGTTAGLPRHSTRTGGCGTCGGSGTVERTIYKSQKVFDAHRIETRLDISGRQRLSRRLKRLQQKAGTRGSSLSLHAAGQTTSKQRRNRVDLDVHSILPLATYPVTSGTGGAGIIEVCPADGTGLVVAERAFLDPAVKSLLPAIRRTPPEELHARAQQDPLLAALLDGGGEAGGQDDLFCGAVSPALLRKVQRARNKAAARRRGLMGRLGLRR